MFSMHNGKLIYGIYNLLMKICYYYMVFCNFSHRFMNDLRMNEIFYGISKRWSFTSVHLLTLEHSITNPNRVFFIFFEKIVFLLLSFVAGASNIVTSFSFFDIFFRIHRYFLIHFILLYFFNSLFAFTISLSITFLIRLKKYVC